MTKSAIITGGTRGIGAAISNLLLAQSWETHSLGRKDVDMAVFGSAVAYLMDAGDHLDLNAIVFSHGEWYSVDYDLHTAYSYIHQYTSRVISPTEFIRRYAPNLKANHGSVTFISSTRGLIGGVDTAPYSLACAAQIALVQGLAREYKGIRFNCICPGLTRTAMGDSVIATGGAKPGAKMQSPESVADVVVQAINSDWNGSIIRVVDGVASEATWSW